MRKTILSVLILIFGLVGLSAASSYRAQALGGIVPDPESDAIATPALLTRLKGTRIFLDSALSYQSRTQLDDDYANINYSGTTNDIKTTVDKNIDLRGTQIGLLNNGTSFGFGILLTPSYFYDERTVTTDPNTLVKNALDTVETTITKGGNLYNGDIFFAFNLGTFALGVKGGYINSDQSTVKSFTTNSTINVKSNLKYLYESTKFKTGLSGVFSDDKTKSFGFNVEAMFGTIVDNNNPMWVVTLIPQNYIASNGGCYYLKKSTSSLDLSSSFFGDIRSGENGLIRFTVGFNYANDDFTYEKTKMVALNYSLLTNTVVTEKQSSISPSASFSYLLNYNRTLVASSIGFGLNNSTGIVNFDFTPGNAPTGLGQEYTETISSLSMNLTPVFAIEASALPRLIVRGSLSPTLLQYTSSTYQKADAFNKGTTNVVKSTGNSYWEIFPDFDIVSGVTFKISEKVILDLISGLTIKPFSTSSDKIESFKERPSFDATKKSPLDTDKKSGFWLNLGLTILI